MDAHVSKASRSDTGCQVKKDCLLPCIGFVGRCQVDDYQVEGCKDWLPVLLICWICWEKIVGDYFHSMRLDDQAMQEVYNLVRNRRGKSIDRLIDRYNETYFRELVWTLEDRAWQLMMHPDVLRKLTQPFHL